MSAVAQQTVERPIIAPGVVEADPAKLVKILTPVSGRIEQLHKALGDPVGAGEPLFTLDSADFAQAQSDAAKAQTLLELATRNLERLRKLTVDDIAARKDVEQAESDHAQALLEADRTRARLAQLGLAPGASMGRRYTLRSPIAGRVVELTGAQGGYWNDLTAPIMTVADLSTVWLTASVQEKDLGAVYVGQAAKIAFNAYEGTEIEGSVKYLAGILDPDTRTVKVRIALDNAAGRFRPNMFARVVLRGRPHAAIVVPATALVQSGFNARVFVEVSPWLFEPRIVKTGAQLDDRVEILEGLKPGERIVVKDGVLLND
jgi:cobalt-zinc-cadmium efflux system membrane fusion protein